MDDEIFEMPETSGEGAGSQESEPAPAPEPEPTPDLAPEPEPAPAPDSALEPEAPAAPVEVISVEDLLNRITAGEDGEAEELPQETEGDASAEAPADSGEALPAEGTLDGPIEVIGMGKVLKRLEALQGVEDHPMMETPFDDYTVTEGLLLLIFVILLLNFFLDLLRRWF